MIAASTSTIIFSRLASAGRERPASRTLITQAAHVGRQIVLPSMP